MSGRDLALAEVHQCLVSYVKSKGWDPTHKNIRKATVAIVASCGDVMDPLIFTRRWVNRAENPTDSFAATQAMVFDAMLTDGESLGGNNAD